MSGSMSVRNDLALLTRGDFNHEAVIRVSVDHIDDLYPSGIIPPGRYITTK